MHVHMNKYKKIVPSYVVDKLQVQYRSQVRIAIVHLIEEAGMLVFDQRLLAAAHPY